MSTTLETRGCPLSSPHVMAQLPRWTLNQATGAVPFIHSFIHLLKCLVSTLFVLGFVLGPGNGLWW